MARATYYIKEQTTWRDTEKEEVREVFNSTRKAETERSSTDSKRETRTSPTEEWDTSRLRSSPWLAR